MSQRAPVPSLWWPSTPDGFLGMPFPISRSTGWRCLIPPDASLWWTHLAISPQRFATPLSTIYLAPSCARDADSSLHPAFAQWHADSQTLSRSKPYFHVTRRSSTVLAWPVFGHSTPEFEKSVRSLDAHWEDALQTRQSMPDCFQSDTVLTACLYLLDVHRRGNGLQGWSKGACALCRPLLVGPGEEGRATTRKSKENGTPDKLDGKTDAGGGLKGRSWVARSNLRHLWSARNSQHLDMVPHLLSLIMLGPGCSSGLNGWQ
jgi:hypothetical protein